MTSGGLELTSEPWEMTSGRRELTSEPWEVTSGRLELTSEPWEMTSGRWELTSEGREVSSQSQRRETLTLPADALVGAGDGDAAGLDIGPDFHRIISYRKDEALVADQDAASLDVALDIHAAHLLPPGMRQGSRTVWNRRSVMD